MKTCVINSDGLHYDVFISSKSEDYSIAEEVYDFLRDKGFYVFFADKELPKLANSQYSIEIDKALAATKHLIVVFSNVDYLSSPWVLHEWSSFCNDLKDNIRKEGNLLLITTADILKNRKCDIPESLRHHQSFFIDNYKTSRILDFLPSCVHSSVKNGKGHFSMPEQMMRGIPELGKAQPVVDLTTLSSSNDIMHFNHALKFDRMLRPRRALDELRKISKQDDLIVRYYTLRIRYTLEGGVDENELEDVFVKACNLGCVDAKVNLSSKYLDDWDSKGAANASVNQCLEWLQAAIAEGEPEALVELANAYEDGKYGVPKSKSIVERLYRQAIHAGSLMGRINLGFFYASSYFDNNGDVKSRVMAEDVLRPILMEHLLKNEADADKVVHWIIALAYFIGIVVQKDYSLAIYFSKKVISSKGKSLTQDDILLPTTWLWLGIIYLDQNGGFKNDQEAFKCFTKASEIGTRDGTAENQLAVCYEKGVGIDKDESMAIKWYRRAADKGSASALVNLATINLDKGNVEEGKGQLLKAVELGENEAKLLMGMCLCEGNYFPKDEARGMGFIKESADLENAQAMERLGLIFLRGLYGTEKDVKKAEEWLTRAAESGNASAECSLGTRYAKGDFDAADTQKAVYWWNRAAEHGDVDAMCNMGHAYLSGIGVMANPHIAFDWFKNAAEAGEVEAMLALGTMCLDEKYGMVDKVQGEKWIKQAADTGDADALNVYAVQFYNGAFGDADKPRAIELWKQAADKECSAAMVSIGECYRDGEGVPADVKQAIRWFERAIELGNTRAMVQLAEIYLHGKGCVVPNEIKSIELFERAAKSGDAVIELQFAFYYMSGAFGAKDFIKALYWYEQSAKHGMGIAYIFMGLLYSNDYFVNGQVKKDLEKARMAFQSAVDQDVEIGAYFIANYYIGRLGFEEYRYKEWVCRLKGLYADSDIMDNQIQKAEGVFRATLNACEQDEACQGEGGGLMKPFIPIIEQGCLMGLARIARYRDNRGDAIRLYSEAAEKGHELAVAELRELKHPILTWLIKLVCRHGNRAKEQAES